jgi:hypothetical protein
MLPRHKVTGIPFIRRLLVGGILVILLMFVFERQLDDALSAFGYNDDFLSYFPFIKPMYLRFLSSKKTANIGVAHFHILDLVLWLSIAVWGTWLTVVTINFKHYDDGFRLGLSRVSERYRGQRPFLYISCIFMLFTPVLLTIQPKPLANNPEFLFILTYIPQFYFFVVALSYYFIGGLLSMLILILLWKLFWQDRPIDVVLESGQKEKT